MAEIIKDDDLNLDDLDDELDNDESYDLDGDSDEDIDTEFDDEETDDAEADDGEDELDDTDTDEDDETDTTDDEGDKSDKDTDPAAESATDEKDARIKELETQLSNVRNLSKETLQKMGVQVGDGVSVEEALEKANAESEGISLEEYRKARAATAEAQAAERQAQLQAFEKLAATDLSELKKSFPDLLNHKHIQDCFDSMEDFKQFGKLRDNGVEPKTAYLAVNGDKVRTKQAAAAQQKATSGGKQHLTSAVPKKASGDNIVIPKEELRQFREMFPNLPEKELRALYKQTL